MKKTSGNTGQTLKVLGLVISLAALPLLLGVTGCTTGNRYQQSTGERIDDHGTSSRVKSALSDDRQYKYSDVNVKTFKGTAQLSDTRLHLVLGNTPKTIDFQDLVSFKSYDGCC